MKILGISGKKQSGKNTMFNLILGNEMLLLAIVRDKFKITSQGKLEVSDIFGDTAHTGIFDVERNNDSMRNFLAEYVYPYIRNYSLAHILKQVVCVDILGLKYEQVFGTDAQKSTPTHILWENVPGNVKIEQRETESLGNIYYSIVPKSHGPMSGREVMQYVGTEIFRKMYNDVWASSCMRQILKDKSEFAVITDVRFPNEVEAIKNAGGKVIRLTRDIFAGQDVHWSETALDANVYDWNNFDAVIDNHTMTIGMQNEEMLRILGDWGFIDKVELDVE
jgi:hypothetical protein